MDIQINRLLSSSITDICCLDISKKRPIIEELILGKWKYFSIELGDEEAEWDVFLAIVRNIPTDPPYGSFHDDINLMALSDSLWGGLGNAGNVAFIISNAELLVAKHINFVLQFHNVLCNLDRVRDHRKYQGRFKTFLLGTGPNFS